MGYRPQRTHTDANRNLVSNIHGRGLSAKVAADGILELAAQMMKARLSGPELTANVNILQGEMPGSKPPGRHPTG
jgi:ethanolamine ammonia-lyase small subunit